MLLGQSPKLSRGIIELHEVQDLGKHQSVIQRGVKLVYKMKMSPAIDDEVKCQPLYTILLTMVSGFCAFFKMDYTLN